MPTLEKHCLKSPGSAQMIAELKFPFGEDLRGQINMLQGKLISGYPNWTSFGFIFPLFNFIILALYYHALGIMGKLEDFYK